MEKILSNLIAQFREFYKGLGPTKRVSILASVGVVGISLTILAFMLSGRDYAPLFTNIPQDQVTTIIEKLNQKNISFQLRDDGKTIAVPTALLHSTQMVLMAELGTDKIGTVGLEVFEKQDFGVNSYAQRVNYQRALQGELMRSINTLTAVKKSKVMVALPEKKNFLEEGSKATASVILELHNGKTLNQDQVRGIRFLVASAVQGLDAENVTVVDERGKMLSRQTDGGTGATGELMEMKAKVESGLEERIESILSKVVGSGKVIARVDATLNHRATQSVEETVDAEGTALRSQQTESESLDGSRGVPGGAPGTQSNLPGGNGQAGASGFNQNVRKELATNNFEVPKTVKNIKEAAGGLQKISVAVLVDGVEVSTTKDGNTTTEWAPRSAEEVAKYESLVKSAIGFDSKRGDSVKIESIKFLPEDFSDAEQILTTLERKKLLQSLLKWGLLGFSLALFFFVVVRPFMQWITDSFQDSVDDMLPRTIEELEELHAVDGGLPGMNSVLPSISESIDPEKAESELLKDRIVALMEKDEEKATNAFGMWLVRKDL